MFNCWQTPVVAMLGSGGGFRAMIALCGVFKALKDSGIFEMCMYIAGLSGSTWFVSQLYTHPDFPNVPTEEMLDYFRQRTRMGLLSHLGAPTLMRSVLKCRSGYVLSDRAIQPSLSAEASRLAGESVAERRRPAAKELLPNTQQQLSKVRSQKSTHCKSTHCQFWLHGSIAEDCGANMRQLQ